MSAAVVALVASSSHPPWPTRSGQQMKVGWEGDYGKPRYGRSIAAACGPEPRRFYERAICRLIPLRLFPQRTCKARSRSRRLSTLGCVDVYGLYHPIRDRELARKTKTKRAARRRPRVPHRWTGRETGGGAVLNVFKTNTILSPGRRERLASRRSTPLPCIAM